jgi:NLI interacting factor-like phosphatase
LFRDSKTPTTRVEASAVASANVASCGVTRDENPAAPTASHATSPIGVIKPEDDPENTLVSKSTCPVAMRPLIMRPSIVPSGAANTEGASYIPASGGSVGTTRREEGGQRSQSAQSSLPDSKPILVLFDLNGVLVHREPFGSTRPHKDMRNAIFMYTANRRVIYVRRHLEKLFSGLLRNNIRIGIWTSAQHHNAGDLVSALMQAVPSFNKAMLLHGGVIIDQQYCVNFGKVDLQNSEKEVFVKCEKELTNHPKWKTHLRQHQMVLVDDSPVKNTVNSRIIGIHPKTFQPSNERTEDEKMVDCLLKYLVRMKQGTLQPFNFALRHPLHELKPACFISPLRLSEIETTRLYDKITDHTRPRDYSRNMKLMLQLHDDGFLKPDDYILNARILVKYKGNNAVKARDLVDSQLRLYKPILSRLGANPAT